MHAWAAGHHAGAAGRLCSPAGSELGLMAVGGLQVTLGEWGSSACHVIPTRWRCSRTSHGICLTHISSPTPHTAAPARKPTAPAAPAQCRLCFSALRGLKTSKLSSALLKLCCSISRSFLALILSTVATNSALKLRLTPARSCRKPCSSHCNPLWRVARAPSATLCQQRQSLPRPYSPA